MIKAIISLDFNRQTDYYEHYMVSLFLNRPIATTLYQTTRCLNIHGGLEKMLQFI